MWCIPQVQGEYVARMEDVLDLYAEALDPSRPVVCFDEKPGATYRRGPSANSGNAAQAVANGETIRAAEHTAVAASAITKRNSKLAGRK